MKFSRSYLTNLQNLWISGKNEEALSVASSSCLFNPQIKLESTSKQYDDYLFQILICKPDFDNEYNFKVDEETLKPKMNVELVYGTKKELMKRYTIKPESLPSPGVQVEKDKFSPGNRTPVEMGLVHFFLLGRLVSQMIAYSWIDTKQLDKEEEPDQKKDIQIVREIFNTFNIRPDSVRYIKDGEDDITDEKKIDKLIYKDAEKEEFSLIIKPTCVSYQTIRLALLFAGQAYFNTESSTVEQEIEKPIAVKKVAASQPIFKNGIHSTWEIVYKEAFDLSWNSFEGIQEDISQASFNQVFPPVKFTVCYPPRPSDFNLTEQQVQNWGLAPLSGSQNNLPFYPESPGTLGNITYIVPPYPYLPLSSS